MVRGFSVRLPALALLLASCAVTGNDGHDAGDAMPNLRVWVRSGGWAFGTPLTDELRLTMDGRDVELAGAAMLVLDGPKDVSRLELFYEEEFLDSYLVSASELCSPAIAEPADVQATLCLRSNGEFALASTTCTGASGQTEVADFDCAPRCSPHADGDCPGKCGLLVHFEEPALGHLSCIAAGDRLPGEGCAEGECAVGSSCFQGVCRAFCDSAHPCAGETCSQALRTDSEIWMCLP